VGIETFKPSLAEESEIQEIAIPKTAGEKQANEIGRIC